MQRDPTVRERRPRLLEVAIRRAGDGRFSESNLPLRDGPGPALTHPSFLGGQPRSDYLRSVFNASGRAVVGAFAATRVAIGAAFAIAPGRLGGESAATGETTLMTRSFAVRELVLGVGGLLAVARADSRPSDVRLWAGLGALTDGGDLCASLAGVRRDVWSNRVPVLVAAAGLVCELWAFRAATPDRRGCFTGPLQR
jgi:hypothetical protein